MVEYLFAANIAATHAHLGGVVRVYLNETISRQSTTVQNNLRQRTPVQNN